MIKLYQFPPLWGVPNASPFCLKLETYLRMTDLPYENVYTFESQKAPKKKFPYIDDGGDVIGDSSLIIEHLKKKHGDVLDAHLSEYDQSISRAFAHLMEENLYWCMLYSRWVEPVNFAAMKKEGFSSLPPIMRDLIAGKIRKSLIKDLYAHGMGRHKPHQLYRIGEGDLVALSEFLGDKTFFMGEKPATLDATAYGFLANVLLVPVDSPLKDLAKQRKNLVKFTHRMKEKYYE